MCKILIKYFVFSLSLSFSFWYRKSCILLTSPFSITAYSTSDFKMQCVQRLVQFEKMFHNSTDFLDFIEEGKKDNSRKEFLNFVEETLVDKRTEALSIYSCDNEVDDVTDDEEKSLYSFNAFINLKSPGDRTILDVEEENDFEILSVNTSEFLNGFETSFQKSDKAGLTSKEEEVVMLKSNLKRKMDFKTNVEEDKTNMEEEKTERRKSKRVKTVKKVNQFPLLALGLLQF